MEAKDLLNALILRFNLDEQTVLRDLVKFTKTSPEKSIEGLLDHSKTLGRKEGYLECLKDVITCLEMIQNQLGE